MSAAIDNIGAHLLGRVAGERDERDFPIAPFLLTGSATPLEVATAKVLSSHAAQSVKDWVAIAAPLLGANPVPVPTPTPTPTPTPVPVPSGAVDWSDAEQLDQGQTGHCVGFGWAQFGNTLPVDDHFTNADGDAIYYETKIIEREPGKENGAQVIDGAKAMQNRGRIKNYARAATVDECRAWVLNHGPLVVGTDWYDSMFNPDPDGFIFPVGSLAGGHCWLVVGWDPTTDVLTAQNSWGSGWGLNGYFKMHAVNFGQLLDAQGDAFAAVELATASTGSPPPADNVVSLNALAGVGELDPAA